LREEADVNESLNGIGSPHRCPSDFQLACLHGNMTLYFFVRQLETVADTPCVVKRNDGFEGIRDVVLQLRWSLGSQRSTNCRVSG